MIIDRVRDQGGFDEAMKRITFCLDQLEKADGFKNKLDWQSDIVHHCTIEEILCALVSAEQELKKTLEVSGK